MYIGDSFEDEYLLVRSYGFECIVC